MNKIISVEDVTADLDHIHTALPWAVIQFVLVALPDVRTTYKSKRNQELSLELNERNVLLAWSIPMVLCFEVSKVSNQTINIGL